MGNGSNSFKSEENFASPPCIAAEVDPGYFDPLGVDPEQARDVARWRTAERKRLREARRPFSSPERTQTSVALMTGLERLLAGHSAGKGNEVVAFYWPIKDEPDLRPLMVEMQASGCRIALPLVETRAAPLVFRLWTPETRMERGHWNIPVPPRDAPEVMPDIVLTPLMGWDSEGYRLGYGGGYFDRTLAVLTPRPFSIGVGLSAAKLPTIYPQPHDIPMDVILTERGIEVGG